MDYSSIDTIIFDLGRVVIHLDEGRTFNKFLEIGNVTESELLGQLVEPYFNQFERGEISEEEFRNHIVKGLKNDLNSDAIDEAWNAMLGEIDKDLIDLILSLKGQYNLLVLSNTNIIHETAFNKTLKQATGFSNLHQIFHKVYFSHEIGERKPQLKSWQMILDEQNLLPETVLFLDDREDNIEAAQSLGINTILVSSPRHTFDILKTNFV